MEKVQAKRDASVELARLIGCIIVVCCHSYLSYLTDAGIDISRLFFGCIFADGVAIFWMIMGCFVFRYKSVKSIYLKTAKRVLLPFVLVLVFYWFFGNALLSGQSLAESVMRSPNELVTWITILVKGMIPVSDINHLWYLQSYICIVAILPVFRPFADQISKNIKYQKIFFLIAVILLIINDLTDSSYMNFSYPPLEKMVPMIILIMMGRYLYENKERFLGWKYSVASIVLFFGMNALRCYLLYNALSEDVSNTLLLYWFTFFGMVNAVAVFMFCLSLRDKIEKTNRFAGFIRYIASFTFIIYIVHYPIIGILSRGGFFDRVTTILNECVGYGIVYESLYVVIKMFVTFILSFLMALIIKGIIAIFGRITVALSARKKEK